MKPAASKTRGFRSAQQRRFLVLALLALGVVAGVYWLSTLKRTRVQSQIPGVSYGESFSIASYLNVHAGTWHYVDLWGHTIEKVRGSAPYWLDLPKSHRLLLISDADASSVTIIVAEIATRQIHRIEGRGTSLGHDFGGSSPDTAWAEWLEADHGSIIVIRKNAGDLKVRMTIDLDTGTSASALVD